MERGRIESLWIARGFDGTRGRADGHVDDDLDVLAPGLRGEDGRVRVARLAQALSHDEVVIDGSAVVAGRHDGPRELAEIRRLVDTRLDLIEALRRCDARDPNSSYNRRRVVAQVGSSVKLEHVSPNYAGASLELATHLDELGKRLVEDPQPGIREISLAARQVVSTFLAMVKGADPSAGTPEEIYDRLVALTRGVAEGIQAPVQPEAALAPLAGHVGRAQAAAEDQASFEHADLQGLIRRGEELAAELHARRRSIPWWHYALLFGAVENVRNTAALARLKRSLDVARMVSRLADPAVRHADVARISRQAYELQRQGAGIDTADDAAVLAAKAGSAVERARDLAETLEEQNRLLRALAKAVKGVSASGVCQLPPSICRINSSSELPNALRSARTAGWVAATVSA